MIRLPMAMIWLLMDYPPRPDTQNLFPIVQGGLDEEKRKDCAAKLTARDVPGFAIGGLSGGEEKVNIDQSQAPLAWPSELARYLVTLVMFSTLAPIYTVMVSGNMVYNVFTASALVSVAMLVKSKTGTSKEKDL